MSSFKSFSVEDLHTILVMHKIPHEHQFIPKAGREFGIVRSWPIHDGLSVVECRRGQSTTVYLGHQSKYLAHYLIRTDLDRLETLLQNANVLGAGAIHAASVDHDGPFYVLVTRFYEAAELSSLVPEDTARETPRRFPDHQTAQAWITEAISLGYKWDPSAPPRTETDFPDYKIVTTH